jgi:outer membrane lipoprotein LolB
MRIFTRLFLVLAATLFVVACSTTPSSDKYLPVVDREKAFDRNQDKLSNLDSWQFEGRFSVRHLKKADSANISWLEDGDDYLLKISGPLQQGTVFIRGDENGIAYKDAKGVTDSAKTPEELLHRHTQYELPISSLRYWVLGRPDPRYAFDLNIAATGDLRWLKQQGWEIHYEWFKTHEPYRLPGKITLKNDTLDITISIHEWNPSL